MVVKLLDYLNDLYEFVPKELYWCLLILFCVGSTLFIFRFGFQQAVKYIIRLVLIEYILFVYCSTVIFRESLAEHTFNFVPFWSYFDTYEVLKPGYIMGDIMNIVVFLPIGALLGMSFDEIKMRTVIYIGLGLSISIEVLQFVLKRGFSELDDVIHNTIGCVLGFCLYIILTCVSTKSCGRLL